MYIVFLLFVEREIDIYSYSRQIQDIEYNWIISTEEQEFCIEEEFLWVKNLPLIIYKPKILSLI